MSWADCVASMGSTQALVGKPEGRRQLGETQKLMGNIKMDVQEVGWGGDWTDLTLKQDT